MEMVEGERHQRDFDGKACGDDPEQRREDPRDRAFLAPLEKRRAQLVEWRATIDVTAAKLIWKLGPASASGRKTRTTNAPVAISRMLSASRPSAIPARINSAATQLRTVGTCIPVNKV